jgi:hypothetical protein
LRFIILRAYDLLDHELANAPTWTETARYDITEPISSRTDSGSSCVKRRARCRSTRACRSTADRVPSSHHRHLTATSGTRTNVPR